jgi:hypothetical protein
MGLFKPGEQFHAALRTAAVLIVWQQLHALQPSASRTLYCFWTVHPRRYYEPYRQVLRDNLPLEATERMAFQLQSGGATND